MPWSASTPTTRSRAGANIRGSTRRPTSTRADKPLPKGGAGRDGGATAAFGSGQENSSFFAVARVARVDGQNDGRVTVALGRPHSQANVRFAPASDCLGQV